MGEPVDPIELRGDVMRARSAYYKGELSLKALYDVVDHYLDACEAKAKTLWPGRRYRRPTRAYILRAL